MKFKHFSELSNILNYINIIYLIKFKIKFLKMKFLINIFPKKKIIFFLNFPYYFKK
jgi:hypothetical protein